MLLKTEKERKRRAHLSQREVTDINIGSNSHVMHLSKMSGLSLKLTPFCFVPVFINKKSCSTLIVVVVFSSGAWEVNILQCMTVFILKMLSEINLV